MKPSVHTLRALATGLVTGAALSLVRAPLGLELALTPALTATTALTWRALALGATALLLGRWGGARPRLVPLLWGLVLGFALHGMVLADQVRVTGRIELYALLALFLLVGWLLRSREVPSESETGPAAGPLERVGLLVAGAGVAVALEAVARPLRLLGGATPVDGAAFGSAFLVLLALGAAAFGSLIPRRHHAAATAPVLALAALACVASLQAVEGFSSRDGLDAFLRSWPWKLDLSEIGRMRGDLLLGARVLLLPAFLLGTGLVLAARGARLAWIALGAALGLLAMPALVELQAASDVGTAAEASSRLVVLACALCSVGGAVAVFGLRAPLVRVGLVGAVACLAPLAVALILPAGRALPISPWERFQVEPVLVECTPEGLLTLEPTRDLGYVVTLDRRRLSPSPIGEAADEQRLRLAWGRVVPSASGPSERRVLLVGQLTPSRARTLQELGATHVDRTGAWHAQMDRLEQRLFEDTERPPGRILAPHELGSAGPWALVVVPPVEGAAPLVPPAEERFTPRVVWLAARSWCAGMEWGERVLLSSSGLDDICIAPRQPDGFPVGPPVRVPAPWQRLADRPFERETAAVSAALGRIATGSQGTPYEAVADGLARLAAAQVRSSPFETHAQQTEIDNAGLRRLRDAALAAEPDLFLHDLWSTLAWLLAEKREIELIQDEVGPIAARWQPWWQLELALAQADMESLDPSSAAEHMLRAAEVRPLDLGLRMACAEALSMAGRPLEAAAQLRAIDAVQPGRRDVRRLLAMELARAGDPSAGALLEELIAENPADVELQAFLGPGPYPPPEVRFEPYASGAHDHDEHP